MGTYSRRALLGERVTVAGFPLSGLLADDLNVTSGAISALTAEFVASGSYEVEVGGRRVVARLLANTSG